jgi:hypothetical protein
LYRIFSGTFSKLEPLEEIPGKQKTVIFLLLSSYETWKVLISVHDFGSVSNAN